MSAAIATIGHNNPPEEPIPLDVVKKSTDAVFEEAKHWLEGGKVQSQAEADAIAELRNQALRLAEDAAKAKDKEKRPHLDANKAIEERFRPVVTRITLISSCCKTALAPWEEAQEAIRRAKAEAARKEAEEKAVAAQEAVRAASRAGIEERERAEELLRDAKKAGAVATRAENAKSETKVGGRSVSLRTTYRAEITDAVEYVRFVWKDNRDELTAFLEGLAQRQVNAGRRNLPGVTIRETRSAV